jgi:formate-dependent phosphoribosylglycinamide formyltransferase (GAR transformylase)|nr:ATP-grasp domain-containing protein [Kofleriaceae bacterium]
MPHVVFIAPHFLENTNRYVRAFAKLGVQLSVISEDVEDRVPGDVHAAISGHYRVGHCLDAAQLTEATRAIAAALGPVDRLVGVLEQLQTPMADVRGALGIAGLQPETARNFRDKDRMKAVLRAAGVPVAQSVLATSLRDVEAMIERVGYPVIVKPQAGLGAKATHRIESAEQLAQLAQLAPPTRDAPVQVEEFVRAREHTCETVTVRGTPVWRSGTRYFPSPLEVLETPWVQYCVLLPRETDDQTWRNFDAVNGAALAALFGDAAKTAAGTAITHMEWFLREDGTALVNEVGARPPGVQIMPLMSLAHDTSMFADWARLMALDEFTPRRRVYAAGAAFFRGSGAGSRVVAVDGVAAAIEACGDALVEMRAPKVGMPRADSYEGEGWAIVTSPTTEGCKQALLALIERVQVRYG